MKYFLVLLLSITAFNSWSQECYSVFLNEGVTAFQKLDFEKALNQFNAAKICDDCPSGQSEVKDWINKTQTGYIDAIKKARDEALALKAEAEGPSILFKRARTGV